jgi:hypothetical protein
MVEVLAASSPSPVSAVHASIFPLGDKEAKNLFFCSGDADSQA